MIKMQIIGHLGKDAEVNMHGTHTVINFSVAHTEKYKDSNGVQMNKTVWVSCAWWTDRTNVAQYLKKGTQVWAEGQPEVKMWRDNGSGENKAGLNMRVMSVQLLGGKKEEGQPGPQAAPQPANNTGGYQPMQTETNTNEIDDLPF